MEVKIIKFISGEEVIAKFEDGKFKKLRMFQLTNDGNAGLVPWLVLAPDAEIELDAVKYVTCIDAPMDVEKQYLKAVSNIQLLG